MTGRILIADGQATNRITLKVRLMAACYNMQTVSAADQLLSQAADWAPQLVIIGSGVPGASGIALCKELRASPQGAALPVLLMAEASETSAALRAGASAVLDPRCDDMLLMARVRSLLRRGQNDMAADRSEPLTGLAATTIPASVTLVADSAARALCWKHTLAAGLPDRFQVSGPEQALQAAARQQASELYMIAASMDQPGDGLRLMAELLTRSSSRHAGFIVAVPPEQADIAAMALDLGAGDILPLSLAGPDLGKAARLIVTEQIRRKRHGDQQRAEAERNAHFAMIDPLTGLYNRRYALPRLARAAAGAASGGPRLAVLTMDIDRFKAINDKLGHASGDAVLAEIAARLHDIAGPQALTARLGGEEFLLANPGLDERGAWQLAERLRHAVMDRPILLPTQAGGGQIAVTLSLGIAVSEFGPRDYVAGGEVLAGRLLDKADRAMLAAKAMGRNKTMLAQPEWAA